MAVDPDLYARRLVEHETEKKNWDTTTPIFYFNGMWYHSQYFSRD